MHREMWNGFSHIRNQSRQFRRPFFFPYYFPGDNVGSFHFFLLSRENSRQVPWWIDIHSALTLLFFNNKESTVFVSLFCKWFEHVQICKTFISFKLLRLASDKPHTYKQRGRNPFVDDVSIRGKWHTVTLYRYVNFLLPGKNRHLSHVSETFNDK